MLYIVDRRVPLISAVILGHIQTHHHIIDFELHPRGDMLDTKDVL